MRRFLYLPLIVALVPVWVAAVVSNLTRRMTVWSLDRLDSAADWIERGR